MTQKHHEAETPTPHKPHRTVEEKAPTKQAMVPTIGRTVYFVLPKDFKRAGEIRPAIIVKVFPATPDGVQLINLAVLLDGPNDAEGGAQAQAEWVGSAKHDQDAKAPGTWHWMPFQVGQAAQGHAGPVGDLSGLIARVARLECAQDHSGGHTAETPAAPVTPE